MQARNPQLSERLARFLILWGSNCGRPRSLHTVSRSAYFSEFVCVRSCNHASSDAPVYVHRRAAVHGKVVTALLRHGADPSAKDGSGRTAAMGAVLSGRPGALREVGHVVVDVLGVHDEQRQQ